MIPLIRSQKLTKHFSSGENTVYAVNEIDLDIMPGETFGLVGESGCGKSTLGKSLLKLYPPSSGKIFFKELDISTLQDREMRPLRRKMQIIFQDPYSSLNPRMTIEDIVGEPLDIHRLASGSRRKERIAELLVQVGMDPSHLSRFPHEFSGGQRQRIGIARALAVEPEFIVCDEPISALDVSVQAQIIHLLKELQEQHQLTFLFIAHDLSVVRHLCNRVAVMYLGHIMEIAPTQELFNNPLHPYTKALLSAVPIPDPKKARQQTRVSLQGDVPSPMKAPKGCPFASRCPLAIEKCRQVTPKLQESGTGHQAACHLLESTKSTYRALEKQIRSQTNSVASPKNIYRESTLLGLS